MKIESRSKIIRALLAGGLLLVAITSAASAQTWVYTPFIICNDSPTLGVPLLHGTRGLDLSATGIIVANQATATVTIHQIDDATNLENIITVPTVGPEYRNGPRGVVLYDPDGRERRLIICTYDGLICTWKPTLQRKTVAVIQVNRSALGARFLGLDIWLGDRGKPQTYLVNAGANQIEQYSHNWKLVRRFRDRGLSGDYTPVSLCVSGDLLYTGWRYMGPIGEDPSQTPPHFISVFELDGKVLRRFPLLNGFVPVGMAITPPNFGDQGGMLLVCTFNRIKLWDPNTGADLGWILDGGPDGPPLFLDGLTSLKSDGNSRVYFTLSVQTEEDGVIGYLQPQLLPKAN